MKRHILFVPLALLLGCGVGIVTPSVDGSGTIETKSRELGAIQELSVCCGLDVVVKSDQLPARLTVTGDDNILAEVSVQESEGRLEIKMRRTTVLYQPTNPIHVEVAGVQLQSIEASGGAGVRGESFTSDDLILGASGGATLSLRGIDVSRVTLDLSGGSTAALEGSTQRQEIQASGGSVYSGFLLSSETANIRVSGGARAEVDVSSVLEVQASGGSRVDFRGEPGISASTSGGSSVNPADAR